MTLQIVSAVLSVWIAVRLRRKDGARPAHDGAQSRMVSSLGWGFAIVTVPVAGYLGALRFAHGLPVPSLAVVALTVALVGVALFGARVEVTGNVVVDCVLLSGGLVGVCFCVVAGLPAAVSLVSKRGLTVWIMAFGLASLLARIVLWVKEGE